MNLKTKNLLLTAVALPMSLIANATADWQSKSYKYAVIKHLIGCAASMVLVVSVRDKAGIMAAANTSNSLEG